MALKKVLVIIDHDQWAFARFVSGFKKYASRYQVESHNQCSDTQVDYSKYDIYMYMCDYAPERLVEKKLDPAKTIFCVRSMLQNNPFFKDKSCLKELASVILACNSYMYDFFQDYKSTTVLAPGGVDTQVFNFMPRPTPKKTVIGWAGSRDNFGKQFRGIDLIEKFCDGRQDIEYVPAYREDKWRDEKEMVEYYHGIDIYVDLSIEAGRQGGLLEAASCGRPVISSTAGIAPLLIKNGTNGYTINRTTDALARALSNTLTNFTNIQFNARTAIVKSWSWYTQAKILESALDLI